MPVLFLWLAARAETVDRIVLVVADQPVLASDVRLEETLSSVDPGPTPFWTGIAETPLDRLVDAAVVRSAAGDIPLYQPTRDQVAERLRAVRDALRTTPSEGAFPEPAAWSDFLARHGLDETRMAAILRRRMIIERYLLRNVQASVQDAPAWLGEAERLLAGLREGVRVREIPLRSTDAP